jgi:hypothetical protein
MKSAIVFLLLVCAFPAVSQSQVVLLDEDFEGDLSAWEVIGYGIAVADPLVPENQVLSFTGNANSGNMWSYPLSVNGSTTYVISFRYLGNAGGADTGGYLWLVDPLYGNVNSCPVWGTQPENSNFELIDDGQWHTYRLEFHVTDFFTPASGELLVTVEDWDYAAWTNPLPPIFAGDAFFDDIQIYELGALETESATWGEVKALFR